MQYSIVNYKDVQEESNSKRFDAEFFKQEYLLSINLIKNKKFEPLGKIITTLTDYHANGSYEILKNNVEMFDEPDYAFMVRALNFERNDFEEDAKYISEHAYNFLKKTQIFGGELIINKIGNAGNVYYMPTLNKKVSLGMNIFMLRAKSNINSAYLYIFLNTKHGKNVIQRRVTGAVPLSIDKESVREVLVPLFSDKFMNLIGEIVLKSIKFDNETKSLYSRSEEFILKELGLLAWRPKHNLWNIKNFSEIQEAQRIDAEYYQPKFEAIINAVQDYSNGWDKLNDIVSIKKCVEVGSEAYTEEGIPFVRVSNLSKFEINENNQQYISEESYKELAENFLPKKGEILLSKDGTAGIAYYLNDEPKKMIPSGGILRLKVKNKEYLPEYVTLVLNSLIVQEQIERVSSGALIKHWLIDQINDTVIPKLEIGKQKEIVAKIQESFKCREQSKQLLEIAKLGVERAIEENEEIATNWINKEFDKIGVSL